MDRAAAEDPEGTEGEVAVLMTKMNQNNTDSDTTTEPRDTLTNRDEVNEACIGQSLAIRVQHTAPNPTEYYIYNDGQWLRGKHHRYSDRGIVEQVNVNAVREVVDSYASRGDVMAVTIDESPFDHDEEIIHD